MTNLIILKKALLKLRKKQGSYSFWKSGKSGKIGRRFSSQGKVREFGNFFQNSGKSQGILLTQYFLYFDAMLTGYKKFVSEAKKFHQEKFAEFNFVENRLDSFLLFNCVWKMVENSGKIREKSGNSIRNKMYEP